MLSSKKDKKDQKKQKPKKLLNNLYIPNQQPQNPPLQNPYSYLPHNNYPVQRVKIFFFF